MENKIQAGFWRMNITPPMDISIEGGWTDIFPTGIDSDLYVNAIVFDDGKAEFAVLSVDVCWVPDKLSKDIRETVEKICGIPAVNILISATHTHNGPRLADVEYDAYSENFRQLAVTAVQVAKMKKQPVRIGAGKAISDKYVHNRRLKRPDGTITMNFIQGDFIKECVETGATDPEILALKIDDAEGGTLGFIINYANHNNAFPEQMVSSGISGYVGEMLRKIYGPEIGIVFLLGACGNVNWIDFKDPFHRAKDHYKKIATHITGIILQMIPQMEYPDISRVKSAFRIMMEKERPFNDYDTKVDMTFGGGFILDIFEKAKEERKGQPLKTYPLDIHGLCIGEDIVIASNPCELFADYGLQIKAGSPFKYTLIAELTNGCRFYVPTPEAYEEGGYEVRKPATELEIGAGDRIVQATLEIFKELKEQGKYQRRDQEDGLEG